MKKIGYAFSIGILLHAHALAAADVHAVASFLDNLKHLVTRLMTASAVVKQSDSAPIPVNPTLQALVQQVKAQVVAKPTQKSTWTDTLLNLVAFLKPTTETFIGGAYFDGKETKFQPGIIMALLNMVTSLPGALPAGNYNNVREQLTTIAPTADVYNTQVKTFTLRLSYIFNMITSLQKLTESLSSPSK
jgi:hypothetical protein